MMSHAMRWVLAALLAQGCVLIDDFSMFSEGRGGSDAGTDAGDRDSGASTPAAAAPRSATAWTTTATG